MGSLRSSSAKMSPAPVFTKMKSECKVRDERVSALEHSIRTPNVDFLVVQLIIAQQLGCTIPSCLNVVRHLSSFLGHTTSQSKITYCQITVGLDKKIRGLEISMNDVPGMNPLEPSQHLIQKVLMMSIRKLLRRCDDAIKIALKKFRNNIQILEIVRVLLTGWTEGDFEDSSHVLVRSQMRQQLDLSQNTFRIHKILKHILHLLDRNSTIF